MTPLSRLLLPLLVVLLVLPTGPALAVDEPQPTALALTSQVAEALIDTPVDVTATLTSNGTPVAGQPVEVQVHDGTAWQPAATGTTDTAGAVRVRVAITRSTNRYRAVYAGDATHLPAINPWENPYRSRVGWLPNSWWAYRSDPRVAWRSSDHRVVRILRANGFRWSYAGSDAQHFDGRVATTGITFTG